MLTDLRISNYALIESLDLELTSGFAVITGETGAGKSIVLGALGLLCGNRADAKVIKAGKAKCTVEAVFDVRDMDLSDLLSDDETDFDGRECILRREISANGKSRAFLNDTPVPAARLKEIAPRLIDIHSQHQNLLLGQEDFLLQTLDTVAGNEAERTAYEEAFRQHVEAVAALKQLREQAERDAQDAEFLRFRLTQIQEADLHEGEQAELEQEADLLGHTEEIKSSLYAALAAIRTEDADITASLRQGVQMLEHITDVFPTAAELAERMESVRIELADIADETDRQLERIDFNPARLAYVEDRLNTIYTLEKRLGAADYEELLAKAEELRTRLAQIENIDDLLAAKALEAERCGQEMRRQGELLTATRRESARQIVEALRQTLQTLGMPAVSLEISLTPRPTPALSGTDAATFRFSANKNVPMQDVARIASGGEIARVMLALKTLVAAHRNLPTVVFDEIDTGVSGKMAERMAEVMQRMAAHCQVICITHLPQIAALGSSHYLVEKTEDAEGTASHLRRLTDAERVEELAKMLSGAQITEAAVENAKTLLHLAANAAPQP